MKLMKLKLFKYTIKLEGMKSFERRTGIFTRFGVNFIKIRSLKNGISNSVEGREIFLSIFESDVCHTVFENDISHSIDKSEILALLKNFR